MNITTGNKKRRKSNPGSGTGKIGQEQEYIQKKKDRKETVLNVNSLFMTI